MSVAQELSHLVENAAKIAINVLSLIGALPHFVFLQTYFLDIHD